MRQGDDEPQAPDPVTELFNSLSVTQVARLAMRWIAKDGGRWEAFKKWIHDGVCSDPAFLPRDPG